MASKNVEVANSGKIQAEMDAEKADIQASHVAKIATAKIESVRASAAKGVELAKRRSEVPAACVRCLLQDIALNLCPFAGCISETDCTRRAIEESRQAARLNSR